MSQKRPSPRSDTRTAAPDPPGPDDPRWLAILARDSRHDGRYVFGVRSTGIYCRPSCPAKKPGREQVIFYDAPDDAERAGFRACLRCRPREGAAAAPQAALVRRVCRYIEENADLERVTLDALAKEVGLSPFHLQRTFRRAMGISPRQYADAFRLERLKTHLKRKEPVTMAMYEAGYGSSSRLYERAPGQLGMTPGDYKAGGKDQEIAFTMARTPIGPMLVAATHRGICSIRIGGAEAEMRRGLAREFPAAKLRRDESALGRWVRAIVEHLEGKLPRLDLPVDARATAFQWRVWEELRAIPYGETRSYQEVARLVGRPRAARAVGRACATNPVAIVIPCHRVVRNDGSLGGYAWGLDVKRALLDRERGRKRGGPGAAKATSTGAAPPTRRAR
jgi:AraC family transcriptional regulator of adaptative response/methylated-DNA-[protein]-cysteine methyltransferase